MVLIAEQQRVPRSRPAPRLRLLTELEPRHRVFFGNLADLILSRRVPQAPITSRPAAFWDDVFVPSDISWIAFLESMIWHVLVLTLFVWGQSRVWEPVKLFPQRETVHRTITYYPPPMPTHTFQASQSRAAAVRPRVRHTPTPAAVHQAVHQAPMPVTPEQKPRMVTPPDIKEATAKLPNVLSSHAVTPMPPLPATAELRRKGLAGPSEVVAPLPQVDKATGRQLVLPQASAVAPAPEVIAGSGGRAMKAPNNSQVVPPPPSVQSAGSSTRDGRLSSLAGGPSVVPAPPSVQRAGDAAGDPRLRSIAGAGSQVVLPPPSVQGSSSSGTGRLSSLTGARPNVVLPPPSVQGAAAGTARLGSMTGSGSQVIPPPPSVQSSVGSGGARLGSLSAAGSEVVAPPPSVEGSGNAGRGGRLASLSGDGAPLAPARASVAGNAAGGSTGKVLEPMDPLPGDGASSGMTAGNENQSSVEELPLGFLGVVFAAPGTSFFSNFEVFVAKRRVGGNLQLIKLVYEFLPYQRRLSEYDLNNLPPRVIKLRVTPDPSCDEALGHIIQPPTEAASTGTESPKIPAALRSFDPNSVLPCYRTTASDFQKAMSGGR